MFGNVKSTIQSQPWAQWFTKLVVKPALDPPGDPTLFLRGDDTWQIPTGFVPGAHANSHVANGSDPLVSLSQSQTTNLVSDLANKFDTANDSSTINFTSAGTTITGSVIQENINHANLANVGNNTHAQIDSHIANVSNPHDVTEAQILPDQANNANKYLQTDGASSSWVDINANDVADTEYQTSDLLTIGPSDYSLCSVTYNKTHVFASSTVQQSVITDTFTGANGTALANHTPNLAPGGSVWLDPTGQIKIENNKATANAAGYVLNTVINANLTTYTLEGDVTSNSGWYNAGIVFRATSNASQALLFYMTGTEVRLLSGFSLIDSVAFASNLAQTYAYKVVVTPANYSLYIDDVHQKTWTDVTFANNTYAGMYIHDAGSTVDDFSIKVDTSVVTSPKIFTTINSLTGSGLLTPTIENITANGCDLIVQNHGGVSSNCTASIMVTG